MRRPSPKARRLAAALLAGTLCLAFPRPMFAVLDSLPLAAATPSPAFSPEAVKAAYLVNFVRFTDWPSDRAPVDSPYVIGISGNRPLEDELLAIADRQLVRRQRLRVVRLRTTHDLENVHLAFFDAASGHSPETLSARDALALLRGRPVLTVSDAPGFLPLGGIVGLYRDGAALRFEVSPHAAHEAGLVISSRLLALARIYNPDTPSAPPP